MKYISAFISFVFVFTVAFWLDFYVSWFLGLYPPARDHPVTVFEHCKDYWIGCLLGAVLGSLSARSVLKKAAKKDGAT